MSEKKKTHLYIIPHTHWDREWYFSKDDIDILMEDNLQAIVSLGSDCTLRNFLLDGQTSLLEEFRSGCPVLWNQIKELLQKKVILTGPWFSQPDFFSTFAESTIRNLETGRDFLKRYGLETKTIYSPDSFGFPENLPQIFKKMGFDNFVYWRGGDYDQLEESVIYNWVSPHGEMIKSFCYYYGYFMLGSLFPYHELKKDMAKNNNVLSSLKIKDSWIHNFINNSQEMISNIESKTKNVNRRALIPLGGDQGPITSSITKFIEKVNEVDQNKEWFISNFENFFNDIKEHKLNEFYGELKTPFRGRVHKTITSHRYDVKKINRDIEILFYNILDPMAVIFKQIYPDYVLKGNIEPAIRMLLLSQAHDSMGSCCTDSTNAIILSRLKRVKAIVGSYIELIKKKISESTDVKNNDFYIYNLIPYANNTIFFADIFTTNEKFEILSGNEKIPYIIKKDKQYMTVRSLKTTINIINIQVLEQQSAFNNSSTQLGTKN